MLNRMWYQKSRSQKSEQSVLIQIELEGDANLCFDKFGNTGTDFLRVTCLELRQAETV